MDASTTRNVSPQTAAEAAFLAQALDYYRAVTRTGKEAPLGQFLNEMAVLCSVHHSDLWEKYWTQAI